MKPVTTAAILVLIFSTIGCAQDVQYFPKLALGNTQQDDDFRMKWYTSHLKALGEPSMLQLSGTQMQAYRFVWLRTFHNPVAVRINVRDDGTSLLTVKVANGKGGYDPGVLVRNETRNLTREQTHGYLELVEESDYWNLPTREMMNGVVTLDGAEWILEAVKDGRYKVIVRTSPHKGPVRALGLAMLIKLAGLRIPSHELY